MWNLPLLGILVTPDIIWCSSATTAPHTRLAQRAVLLIGTHVGSCLPESDRPFDNRQKQASRVGTYLFRLIGAYGLVGAIMTCSWSGASFLFIPLVIPWFVVEMVVQPFL